MHIKTAATWLHLQKLEQFLAQFFSKLTGAKFETHKHVAGKTFGYSALDIKEQVVSPNE